jgi:HSP20 family protein
MVENSAGTGFWPSLYEPFRNFGARMADWLAPAAEASEATDAYRIALELPGVAEDDIHVSSQDGVLTVKGEKKTAREQEGETWYFSERRFGAFSRSFRLPADADAAGITASMKDGVLSVSVPRKAAVPPAQTRIPISKG